MKCSYKKTVVFDLDGTLLDCMPRYYEVLRTYLADIGIGAEKLDYVFFGNSKRNGKKEHEIVKELYGINIQIDDYVRHKRDKLETESMLNLDKIILNPLENIIKLKNNGFNVILLSVRRHRNNALIQLKNLGLIDVFDEIYFVRPSKENPKIKCLKEIGFTNGILIGDGQFEMEAAKATDSTAFFVDTGLNSINHIMGKCIYCRNYAEAVNMIVNGIEE